MQLFRYRAIGRNGDTLSGELTAANEDAAKRALQSEGHFPIKLVEAGTKTGTPWWKKEISLGPKQDIRALSRLVLEFGTLLKAGLTVDRALQLSAGTLSHSPLARAVLTARDAVREGASLADALQADRDHFPVLMISLVRAGEMTGSLPQVMLGLSGHFERVLEVRDKLRAALIYPLILSVLAFLSIIFILLAVIPEFRPLLEGAGVDLPWTTLVLFSASRFLESYWLVVVIVMLALCGLAALSLRDRSNRTWLARQLGRMPYVGPLLRASDAARFSRSMSILTRSSVPVPLAVDVARATQASLDEAGRLEIVNEAVKTGSPLSEALYTQGGYPDVLIELTRVGEESSRLGEMMEHAADILDRELARQLDSFVTYLTPVLTIVIGLIIGILISSVFTALLSINELAI